MSFSLRAFLVVFALLGGGSSYAAGSSGIIKVDSVEVLSDGRALITPESGYTIANPSGCDGSAQILLVENGAADADGRNFDRLLSAILTASFSNQDQWYWLTECASWSGGTIPVIATVRVYAP